MLRDFFLPPAVESPSLAPARRPEVVDEAAQWTPPALSRVAHLLADRGVLALARIGEAALLGAWAETVEVFLDPCSPERRSLDPQLARLCRLSPAGLAAGLEAVLGGVQAGPAAALFERARHQVGSPDEGRPVLAVLASNLPALAVQPLLPALALGRPAFLKSASAEPLFAPAFLAALARREPRLGEALAAATWPGGDAALEAPLLAAAGTVLAYGGQETLDDLARRMAGTRATLVGYGPKTSLAVVGAEVDPLEIAPGLARDVALFDQRGCLSIAAVYTAGDPDELAARLAEALEDLAARWPPGPPETRATATVQQLRLTAQMRGLTMPSLPLAVGTVIVDPEPAFHPSPGRRAIRIHPLADLARLPEILLPWRGRLQGAALAGEAARRISPGLAELGVSRVAAPGELQSPDAAWHNGGIDPLTALGL